MRIVDLTLPVKAVEMHRDAPAAPAREQATITTRIWHLPKPEPGYEARVHYFNHWSMSGTYLDLPGHVVETDDGTDAVTLPVERLFRVDAQVIRLGRAENPGPVTAAELARACPSAAPTPALIVNALGDRRPDPIRERAIFFEREAVDWMISRGISLLVSDVYECAAEPRGVFSMLFAAGVITVCCPASLGRLRAAAVRVTALPIRICGATQIPCRLVVEEP